MPVSFVLLQQPCVLHFAVTLFVTPSPGHDTPDIYLSFTFVVSVLVFVPPPQAAEHDPYSPLLTFFVVSLHLLYKTYLLFLNINFI